MLNKTKTLLVRSSLRTRITMGMLLVLMLALWLVTLFVGHSLRNGMEKTISAQQFSAVSMAAQDVERELRERMSTMEITAQQLSAVIDKPQRVQQFIDGRYFYSILFNWGVVVLDRRGVAIASVPPELERTGTDYSGLAAIQQAFAQKGTWATDPMAGKKTGQPVVSITAPIRNEQGETVGLVMGVTNLAKPNFLDNISRSKYGRTGDFFITAPNSRTYVVSSDNKRLLKNGPPRGVNAVYDRYIDGYEGSGLAVSSRGVLELSSSVRIPSTGWLMQSVLPAEEAFAPIRAIQSEMFYGTFLITMFAAAIMAWWLRRELAPLVETSRRVDAMRDGQLPRQRLPIYRNDEIGALTHAFNGLVERIHQDEEKAAEHAANERLRKIVSHVPGVVFQYRLFPNGHGCFPFASEAFFDIYGIPPEAVRENADAIRDMVHPDDFERFFATLHASVAQLSQWRIEYRVCMPDGSIKWLLVEALPEEEGEFILWYGFVADITQAKANEEELRIAATTFQTLDGIVVTDVSGKILRVNPSFTAITGYPPEEVVGKTSAVLKSGRHDSGFYASLWAELSERGSWVGEIWNRRKNGEIYPAWLSITAVRDDSGNTTHYVGTFQDITARKQAESEIRHLAFYDALTQLPNRRLLYDRLQQALVGCRRNARQGALLFLDLDNFKTLNDSHGHDIGDQLLIAVARRLRECVREGDSVSRLGGDEFVVLLEELSGHAAEARRQAETIAAKVLHALNQPYLLDLQEYRGSTSIGITTFDGRENGTDELLRQADLAMYQAKARGRNTTCFFDPSMQADINARSQLEGELHQALANGEFLLHFQPQVNLQGRCTGAEALLRWRNPRLGFVSPAEFIPLAEETGLILPIGEWVLRESCGQLRQWAENPLTAELSLAVNVSPRQFHQESFVPMVKAVLTETGVAPARLKLEITESLLLTDINDAIAKMTELRACGIAFSLDDFGTGYSSLSYLKRLPLDQIKIDQSFVRDILTDPNDTVICRAVIALGRSLALNVIAEGVETLTQWQLLNDEGCHHAQGYLFGRPMPAADFRDWLEGRTFG